MTTPNTNFKTAIWVQPEGWNTQPQYLGCHGIDSVTVPRGTNTAHYCKSPTGEYVVVAKTKDEPGLVTYTVETHIREVLDYLERIRCPVPLIVTAFERGAGNNFANWDRAWVYPGSDVVQENRSGFVGYNTEDVQVQSFDMEADDEIKLVQLRVFRDSSAPPTDAITSVFACDEDLCGTAFAAANTHCDTYYVTAGDSVYANEDGTWSVLAADPFAVAETAIGGACFKLGREAIRLLVFRGVTDATGAAEAAYSDDGGDTWVNVDIGSEDGEFISSPKAISVLDQNNIWVGTDLGRIYFSPDGGGSWYLQEDATIHSADWNWIEFFDENNGIAGGETDVIAITADGGQTWTQVNSTGSGDDIVCGALIDTQRAWVGTSGGDIYFTRNGGVSWNLRAGWAGSGTGVVEDMEFYDENIGVMVHNNASPSGSYLITKDGGYSWELIITPANSGLAGVMVCNPLLVYGVGLPSGGTGVVHKLQPSQ